MMTAAAHGTNTPTRIVAHKPTAVEASSRRSVGLMDLSDSREKRSAPMHRFFERVARIDREVC